MNVIKTNGITVKDIFNANNSEAIKDHDGEVISVVDVAIETKVDDQKVAYLKDANGVMFASISPTVIEQALMLIDMLETQSKVDVVVESGVSAQGNTYFVLKLA